MFLPKVATILLITLQLVAAKHLPEALKRCGKNDPKFIDCFRVALSEGFHYFAAGSKEFGLNPYEPLFVEKLDLGSTNGGNVAISQLYENLYVHGMTRTAVTKIDADFKGDKCFWDFTIHGEAIRMEADYTIKGKLLLLPIDAKGRCNNTLHDFDIRHKMKCERFTKNGKTYIRAISYELEINPKSVTFDFKNVLPGADPHLNQEILKTLNENSLEVYGDVKRGFEEGFAKVHVEIGNRFLAQVPEEDIFLP